MTSHSFKTLQQWLSWQENLHPSEIDLGLERVRQVLESLLPHLFDGQSKHFPFKIITVAGTNGKGSTVAMLEAIFTQAGYNVGSYTSPHLLHYNERIKINQIPVSEQSICDAFARIDQARNDISLTYFEFATLAAIDIFTIMNCDVVVLEVGLGGRLDAVNVLDPDVAIITTVDIDHQDWLGDDVNAIGLEKAGIYRQSSPAIYGDNNLPDSIRNKVIEEKLTFFQYGKDYTFEKNAQQWSWSFTTTEQTQTRYNLPLPLLPGPVQLKNAANVLMVLELIKAYCPVTQSEIKRGLQSCKLPGRFQIVSTEPVIILDVSHNVQAAMILRNALEQLNTPGQLHVIVGMLKDKEVDKVLHELVPLVEHWRVIDLNTPRAMQSDLIKTLLDKQLQQRGMDNSVTVQCFTDFNGAYHDFKAYNDTKNQQDKLLVFGSFFTVSDALKTLQNH